MSNVKKPAKSKYTLPEGMEVIYLLKTAEGGVTISANKSAEGAMGALDKIKKEGEWKIHKIASGRAWDHYVGDKFTHFVDTIRLNP